MMDGVTPVYDINGANAQQTAYGEGMWTWVIFLFFLMGKLLNTLCIG